MSNALDLKTGPPTDEEMMWLVQINDDPLAFTWLVKRWEKPIKRLCAQVVRDAYLAEDLCQEAFTRVFIRRKQYRPEARFSTWLWRIALNLCYSTLRKTQSRLDRRLEPRGEEGSPICSEAVSEQFWPDQDLLAREEADLIQHALLSLPDSMRLILILRYWEGMKLREIASKLQIAETTAATRCASALDKLTRLLEKDRSASADKS